MGDRHGHTTAAESSTSNQRAVCDSAEREYAYPYHTIGRIEGESEAQRRGEASPQWPFGSGGARPSPVPCVCR